MVDLLSRAAALARWGNLLLLLLYPLSWTAPLLKAGLLPLFGMSEISVLSGVASLWQSDRLLALVAPMAKTAGLALVSFGLAPRRWLPALTALGRLAMADVFLVALYVTLAKGLGVGRVDTAWGLYLFTGCILASLLFSTVEKTLAQDQ